MNNDHDTAVLLAALRPSSRQMERMPSQRTTAAPDAEKTLTKQLRAVLASQKRLRLVIKGNDVAGQCRQLLDKIGSKIASAKLDDIHEQSEALKRLDRVRKDLENIAFIFE